VVERSADLGLAFDGDADRVIAVDDGGDLIDGDHIIAVCAIDLQQRGLLRDSAVVVTVMTNLGFRLAMQENGITVVETKVGDRAVLEALNHGGYVLGGEQSGHVIFREQATTGDGLLTGITLLDIVKRTGRRLGDLAGVMNRLPQVLVNVRVAERHPDIADQISADIDDAQSELGDTGRVLVRPSGTEPVVRVMVEAPTSQQAASVADRLVAAVGRAAG
jgi:phosphoglucosamine mutase